MCGICGWISYGRDLSNQLETAAAMTQTMSCRGPDDSDTWFHPHAVMGHCRLAVIDIDGGRQPMSVSTQHGPVVIVHSGEVYNFKELRDELVLAGYEFNTRSDTEVVLKAYLHWGSSVPEQLNGMYAFAVFDGRNDTLTLVRDRLGVKPLYYYPVQDGVLFGSEPKAILANHLADPVVDSDGLCELLGVAKTPGHGIWSGMREVMPGTVITFDRRGLRERTYWRLYADCHADDDALTVTTVRELLQDSVQQQLVSDVPLCVLLSGGLDSSALAALAAQHLSAGGQVLRTFAVDYKGQDRDFKPEPGRPSHDAPFAKLMADHINSEHTNVVIDPIEMSDPSVRQAVIAARDAPTGLRDVDLSMFLLFKAIRENSTVAISGEAADEIFGGYPWFHHADIRGVKTFPWEFGRPTDPETLFDPELVKHLNLANYIQESYHSAIKEVPILPGEEPESKRMREICHLHITRMLRSLLDRKDRISMAVGLEVRVPFCDHRLVQYVFDIPWSLKTFDAREKSLLRHAVHDLLPHEIIARVKSGFPSNHSREFVAAVQLQAREKLADAHPATDLFNIITVTNAINADPATVTRRQRIVLEQFLNFATWIDLRSPQFKIN